MELSNLRKYFLACLCALAALSLSAYQAKKPEPKRVVLTAVQAKMIQQIERDIEEVPEVKTLRAQERGIMAGIATSAGMTRWTWKNDKEGIVIEEQAELKEEPKP